MKNILYLFLVLSLINVNAQDKIKIPSNTVIVVKNTHSISSKSLIQGQEIFWKVATDVIVNGKVVVKVGSDVIGRVADVSSSGMVGQSGSLAINFESTKAVDGTVINLTGSINSKGESSVGTSVAVGVILCPLALLMSGEEGKINSGTQSRALTLGEYEIKVD